MSNLIELSAGELELIALEAERCFYSSRYAEARNLFALVFSRTPPGASRLVLYALCLAELGENEQAVEIFDTVTALIDELPEDSPARIAFRSFSEVARTMLPGGARSPERRRSL